jgi:hypothetical protein
MGTDLGSWGMIKGCKMKEGLQGEGNVTMNQT